MSVACGTVRDMTSLHVDCATCRVRGAACADCVISVLLGPPEQAAPTLSPEECTALQVLADSGLVPPLRLVPGNPVVALESRGVDVDPDQPWSLEA